MWARSSKASSPEHDAGEDTNGDSTQCRPIVLIVEDEAGVRRLAQRVLEKSGYKILTAEHGAQALEVIANMPHPPDLVLSDVVMPHMGGKELAMRLKTTAPGLPVLFMSGYANEDMRIDELLEESTFLPKPFTPAALSEKVRRLLEQSGS